MRFEFIEVEKAQYSVVLLCDVLEVSTSGFYAWVKRPTSAQAIRQETLTVKIRAVHQESRSTYGSPRICEQLRNEGELVSPKTVAKIMQNEVIFARKKRKFKATTDSRHTKRISPNLLERDFTTCAPNEAWVTDVTAVWTAEGWTYLAVMLDLYSRRVVGWEVSKSNDTELALSTFNKAALLRNLGPGLIHHSDRGTPYGSDLYIERLDSLDVRRSMSRKGDCWDNAVAESFFSTFEFECRGREDFDDLNAVRVSVRDYIENFYNPKRLHSTLGYVSPISYEVANNRILKTG